MMQHKFLSPLHTILRYLETMTNHFFVKKFEFCETWRKRVYTLFVIGSSFRKQYVNLFGVTKNAFAFHPKTAPPSKDSAECRMKNLFAKCQRKHSTHCTCFVTFSLVHPFCSGYSRIVCSGFYILALHMY